MPPVRFFSITAPDGSVLVDANGSNQIEDRAECYELIYEYAEDNDIYGTFTIYYHLNPKVAKRDSVVTVEAAPDLGAQPAPPTPPEPEPPAPEPDPEPDVGIIGIGTPPTTGAETIFSEDWNDTADADIDALHRFDGDANASVVPANWSYTYVNESNATNPPAEIRTGVGRTGKGLVVWDESNGDPNGWGHDVQVMKHFGDNQYPELWLTLYIKFNTSADVSVLNAAKIFRMGHYHPGVADGTYGTTIFQTGGTTAGGRVTSGLCFYDIKQYPSGNWRHKFSLRGDPDYKMDSLEVIPPETGQERWDDVEFHIIGPSGDRDVNGGDNTASWANVFGDGNWHKYELGMIMNSAADARDGQAILYFDDVLQHSQTDIPYRQTGFREGVTGFNCFSVGGNADNVWDGQNNTEQEFYYIDDITVSTSRLS